MRVKQPLIILIMCLLVHQNLLGNNRKILFQQLKSQKVDSNYVIILFRLAGEYAATDPDSTSLLANEIYKLSNELNYKNGIGRAYFMKGLSFFVKSIDDSAMFWFNRSLKLFQQTKSTEGLGLAYHNIGRLYARRGENSKAKELINKALIYRKQFGEPSAIINTISMLGLLSEGENNFLLAEKYHKEAYNFAKNINPSYLGGMAMESSNLAWLEFRKKNYPKAKEFFKESIRLHKQIDDISGLSEASIGLAEILFEEKLYKQAITLAKKSLDNSYKISNPEGIIGSSKIISNSYEKLGDYYTALTFYKIYEANKDSINKLHSKQEYLNVLTKFEVEQKEGRIKLLESEKKLTLAEADNKALQRNIIIGLLVVIVAAFAAYYIRSKEIKKIEIAQHSEKLQMTFSEKLLNQQEDERKRIAAELHDSLGQNLLIIKNMLDYITHSLSESNETKSQLEELSAIALNSIEEVRTTASNLHPYQLKKMGLSKAISAMIRNFKQGTQININHEIDDVDGKISKESEAHIYRIVQEIMNNAIRHSDASEINISLKNKNDNLIIMINDNGKGFNINNYESHESVSGGFGIIGIKERIRIIGAEIKIESNLGIGSRFEILLPIRTV